MCLFISHTVPRCCLLNFRFLQISGKLCEKENKMVPFFLCLFVLLIVFPSCFVPVIFWVRASSLLLRLMFSWVPASVISFHFIYCFFPVTSFSVALLNPTDHSVWFVVCFFLAPFCPLFKPLIVPSLSFLSVCLSICAGTVC